MQDGQQQLPPHHLPGKENSGACFDSPALILTSPLGLFPFISSHFTPELAARALA